MSPKDTFISFLSLNSWTQYWGNRRAARLLPGHWGPELGSSWSRSKLFVDWVISPDPGVLFCFSHFFWIKGSLWYPRLVSNSLFFCLSHPSSKLHEWAATLTRIVLIQGNYNYFLILKSNLYFLPLLSEHVLLLPRSFSSGPISTCQSLHQTSEHQQ